MVRICLTLSQINASALWISYMCWCLCVVSANSILKSFIFGGRKNACSDPLKLAHSCILSDHRVDLCQQFNRFWTSFSRVSDSDGYDPFIMALYHTSVFLATVLLILTLCFFNYTSAVVLYQQFYRFWHSRSICINSSMDSEILDVRAVH